MRKMIRARWEYWIRHGFLRSESDILKHIPTNAPYAIMLRKERERFYNNAFRQGWTKRQYEQEVAKLYVDREWREPGDRYTDVVVYRMVRWYEQWWRNTAPSDEVDAWVSPSAKKSHHQSDLNHERLLQQKRDYNAQPSVIAKRKAYRLKNRAKIAEAERKRRAFNRTQGLKN